MTANLSPGFMLDLVWDEVARRLHAMLSHRGVRRELAEDVVQETALRVVEREVPFVDANDLFRWTAVVAWRLVIDAARREGRLCDLPPEITSNEDVASEAVGRWWLGAVRRGLQQLPPDERAAILDRPVHSDRKTAVRTAVRRHRARAHLMTLAESLGVFVAALVHQLSSRARRGAAAATMVAAAAVSFVPHVPSYPGEERHPSRVTLQDDVDLSVASRGERAVTVSESVAGTSAPTAGPASAPNVAPPRSHEPRLPSQRIIVDGPTGSSDLGTRPKEPDDAIMCVTVAGLERSCVELPTQLTG